MKSFPVANEQIDYPAVTEAALQHEAQEQLWQPLRQAIHERILPGAVAAISYHGQLYRYAGGWATDTLALRLPATFDTIYDCASLTKVTVTLPLILILAQQGSLSLDDPASRYVPDLQHGAHATITIRQLLAHTSGLPAIVDCYSHSWTMEEAIQHIGQLELQSAPGSARAYSDPGFILLGWLFQQISEMSLDEGAQKLLWQPLHMNNSIFCPPSSLVANIASTEYDAAHADWLRGIVHDENARQLGGIVGHAGLFATANDLLRYGQSWLTGVNGSDCAWLAPVQQSIMLLRSAIQRQTPALPQTHRGLGWVLEGDEADVSGGLLSSTAFGHTGFTGTSLYIDPELELVMVLLTNRVHYGRQHSIQQVRRDFHSTIAASIRAHMK